MLAWALLLAGLVLAAALAISAEAARRQERVVAVFAANSTAAAVLARVAAAEGRIIRETVLPFAVEVTGDRPAIAARLKAAGAWIVLTRLPAHALAVGGCSSLDPAAYPPLAGPLAAGPP